MLLSLAIRQTHGALLRYNDAWALPETKPESLGMFLHLGLLLLMLFLFLTLYFEINIFTIS